MNSAFIQLKALAGDAIQKAKVRTGVVAVIAALIVLQVYFVRELLAAELIFGIGFAVILVLVGVFYLVGSLGERGLELTESGARVVANSARRGYSVIEEIGKKSLRHSHSESAQ